MIKPQVVTDVQMAFPATLGDLIPAEKDIPDQYWESDGTWSDRLFSEMFFKGAKNIKLKPREGIDSSTAFRHVRTIMGSFEPQHEHKEAACRYLLDQWFEDATWEKAK